MVLHVHKYELLVLAVLKEHPKATLEVLTSKSGLGKDEVMWALENLKEKGFVEVAYESRNKVAISPEGKEYASGGLPEERLLKELESTEKKVSMLSDTERIGFQWSKKLGFVEIVDGNLKLTDAGKVAANGGVAMGELLRALSKNPNDHKLIEQHSEELAELSKRKLIEIYKHAEINNVEITEQGISAKDEGSSESIDQIDRNIIANGSWEGKMFKRYDVNVKVERQVPAMKHPLKRLIDKLKDAYVSMGYQEISGPAVESSFWVFDSLFVPQDHPARDAQDTFYISNLDNAKFENMPHIKTVKKAHRKGWHAKWREDVAGQMLLRTHTTSVSSRYVYNIVDELKRNPDSYNLPVKLFSIGRVFRNETIDYRHLADFYQHDGIIIGQNLTLSNLFDELTKIYNFLGIKIRFKPSYFPFVEPGVEFSGYYEKNKEWIELGGAGILREEITGVKRKKLCVLAWGPGLDRALLIKDKRVSNISELYNNNIGWLRDRQEV